MLLGEQLLHGGGQTLFELFLGPRAVEQEHAAFLQILDHVIHGDIGGIVAGDEVRSINLIRALDRVLAEAQVADSQTAGLLGVICEVCLSIHVGVVADDLDRVLVGADSAVRAEAVELAGDSACRSGVEELAQGQGGAGQVIVDADGEVILHLAVEVGEDSLDVGRREFLAAQTITAADDGDILAASFSHGCADIQVQRLTQRAGFLGAVQNSDLLHGCRNSSREHINGERTIEVNLDDTDLFAHFNHLGDGFISNVTAGAHDDDHFLGIGSTNIIIRMICTSSDCLNFAHGLFHDTGNSSVEVVGSFTALEIDVRVLSGACLMRMFRIQSAVTELLDLIPRHDLSEFIIIGEIHLLDFVGGTETIEEMQERYRSLQGCNMGNDCHISSFLNRAGSEHGKTGLTASHNVGMIAEDGQSMISKSTGADMENAGHQFAGNLVHVRDHQQKTLGCSECGGQCTGCE